MNLQQLSRRGFLRKTFENLYSLPTMKKAYMMQILWAFYILADRIYQPGNLRIHLKSYNLTRCSISVIRRMQSTSSSHSFSGSCTSICFTNSSLSWSYHSNSFFPADV